MLIGGYALMFLALHQLHSLIEIYTCVHLLLDE